MNLTDQELHRVLARCAKEMGTHPDQSFWTKALADLGRDDLDAERLREIVSNIPTYVGRWHDYYSAQSSRRAIHRLTPETREGLRGALQEGHVGIVLYFRILDSFPGGNSNMRVLKFVLTPDPAFVFQQYLNLDGTAYQSTRRAHLSMPTDSALKQSPTGHPFSLRRSGNSVLLGSKGCG